MSKIALKANDSGTGTFEIQAPATNTNRVLELPDEAGKVLTTGNSDPAEVFKQSNILGTVSHSAGVPTGAIIERGSNANGEFVRYADGTQICTVQNFDTGVNFSTAGTFAAANVWNLPASFIGGSTNVPVALARAKGENFTGDILRRGSVGIGSYSLNNNTNSAIEFILTDFGGVSNNFVVRLDAFAIGRWF